MTDVAGTMAPTAVGWADLVGPEVRAAARPVRVGRLDRVFELSAEVTGVEAAGGDLVVIDGDPPVLAEVVAIGGGRTTVLPYGPLHGIPPGAEVRTTGTTLMAPVGSAMIGRVIDGMGRAIDDRGPLGAVELVPLRNEPPSPLHRPLVDRPLQTGVRAIDGLLTIGRGQRVGIMAGSGVGKSSLLSMLLRGTDADVTVLALVGERGREVREFIERDLGPAGLARSVIVVATSDRPAIIRRNAAFLATRIAEGFRDQGANVLLLMDSLTRFAMAQREIGLGAGEVPTARGYPPSVFGLLPQLLERAGTSDRGSITGLYTVLVEGDDMNDPIGDTSRAILDGHIVLTRQLANAGHFPSIDVLQSASRVATQVTTDDQQRLALEYRRLLAAGDRARDMVELGLYQPGSDPLIDRALALAEPMAAFARQPMSELTPIDTTWSHLWAAVTGRPPG